MRMFASLTAVLCGLALTGCSGSGPGPAAAGPTQPPLSAFTEGTCAVLAPDLLALGRAAGKLGAGGKIGPKILGELEKAQTALRPVVEGAEPAYKPALTRLVVAAGLVRLEARLDAYKPDTTGKELLTAYDSAVQVCTGKATPSPTS